MYGVEITACFIVFLACVYRDIAGPSGRTVGLRRVSMADCLLVLRVRIPPGAWMVVLGSVVRVVR